VPSSTLTQFQLPACLRNALDVAQPVRQLAHSVLSAATVGDGHLKGKNRNSLLCLYVFSEPFKKGDPSSAASCMQASLLRVAGQHLRVNEDGIFSAAPRDAHDAVQLARQLAEFGNGCWGHVRGQ